MAILKVANVHHDASGFTRTQISTANTYTIFTGNSERLRVDPSGNVGIGIVSPTSLLHVVGTANITSALTVSSIELGNSSDTTLARSSAGNITIEGNVIYRAGGTDVPITDGGTGASDAATARTNLGLGNTDGPIFAGVILNNRAGVTRYVQYHTNNTIRWGVSVTGVGGESGSNTGSDYVISRWADDGSFISNPLLINRATGIITLSQIALTTDLAVADGGTGSSTAAGAANNLGLGTANTPTFNGITLTSGNVLIGRTTSTVGNGVKLDVNGSVNAAAFLVNGVPVASSANVQTFNTSGTWTKPATGTVALIECWGGGGSGGRRGTNGDRASGGGGGGYNYRLIALASLGATETATVGAGGAARSGSNQSGAAGGTTSFGSWVAAYGGGAGGQAASGTVTSGAGGGGQISAGGASSTTSSLGGQPNIVGVNFGASETSGMYFHGGGAGDASSTLNAGGNSLYGGGGGGSASNSGSSSGGASVFGGNGGAGAAGTNAVATAGSQPGGGGGGAAGTSATSGAGGDGRIIVTVW